MNQQDVFASTQIITLNPILNEPLDTKMKYFMYLRKLIRLVKWDKRKYTKAQIKFYRNVLCEGKDVPRHNSSILFASHFSYLLPYDLALMVGFHEKVVKSEKIQIIIEKIISDFNFPKSRSTFFYRSFEAALGDQIAWKSVIKNNYNKVFKPYLSKVRDNILFVNSEPYNILVTATMSAGKSTLVNAMVGKNVCRVQNMACTSKIHTIISKLLDDGVTSEYDSELSLDASREDLLNNNEENMSYKITVGTFFNGELSGKRITLLDSPGVNSSDNIEHTEISHRTLKARKYDLLLYVINSTQLGTTDDEQHLENVKQRLGRTNIIFVINKADQLITEDDNIINSIENQRQFLMSKGFKNPIICPVSSRAAFLVKKSKVEELSRIERREMESFIDKFEFHSLSRYYQKSLGCNNIIANNEEDELLVNCGFAYLERIIKNYIMEEI